MYLIPTVSIPKSGHAKAKFYVCLLRCITMVVSRNYGSREAAILIINFSISYVAIVNSEL